MKKEGIKKLSVCEGVVAERGGGSCLWLQAIISLPMATRWGRGTTNPALLRIAG
ncbi:MAG: hypothetical protein ACK5MG_08480 [Bacteroidales bacterium]